MNGSPGKGRRFSVLPGDLDKLEKGANRKPMKFKGKCKPLHLGKNYPRHQCQLEADQLESSFAGRDLAVLVDTMLNMS
ncbi:hypothetical protein QYF61_022548 [Mycteria americana]|uniref:Uncharacterized protein n=1 Tax=Mycteria americana TaxID=33587 RepID=A0AAN7PLH0_MYCAM|nr:hypothetical protein QYF61_022548 [Mycteria americana]